MEHKIWVDVAWFEWLYKVSNLWDIKSISKRFRNSEFEMRQMTDIDWYKRLWLSKNKKQKPYCVHRIVLESFKWKPEDQRRNQVNHIDGNKQNNCIENLEWVSPKENIAHAKRIWLFDEADKKFNLPVFRIDPKTLTIKRFESAAQASREMNLSKWWGLCINKCCRWYVPKSHWFIWIYDPFKKYDRLYRD